MNEQGGKYIHMDSEEDFINLLKGIGTGSRTMEGQDCNFPNIPCKLRDRAANCSAKGDSGPKLLLKLFPDNIALSDSAMFDLMEEGAEATTIMNDMSHEKDVITLSYTVACGGDPDSRSQVVTAAWFLAFIMGYTVAKLKERR